MKIYVYLDVTRLIQFSFLSLELPTLKSVFILIAYNYLINTKTEFIYFSLLINNID